MDWRQNMGVKSKNELLETYPQYPHNPQKRSLQRSFTDFTDFTDKDRKVKNMNEDVRYWYEERAAIMEFDGGLSREDAEVQAKERMREAIT